MAQQQRSASRSNCRQRSPPGSPPQRQRFLSSALPQTSFPLPDCFFPAVKLTEDKCNQYETIIKATVVEALQEMADHEVNGEGLQYSTPWKLVGEADSLVTYKRADPSNAAVTQARTFGRINGRPNDVLDFFYTDSSREVLKLNELLYHKVMDARVIHNIRTRTDTARHSYLGIKWVAYQPTSSVHRRDNCFLEYMGYAKDAKGRHVGFCASLPIKVRECPDLGDTMRLPRIRTRNVVLVRESDSQPERTHVYVTGAYDTNDSSGDMTMILKRYMGNLRNLSLLRDSKDISQQQMIARVNWVPDHQRKSCKMCQRSFGATRHRHHCRLCGEVVCRKCFVVRTVSKSESSDKPPKMVKRKFCTMCVTSLRRRDSDSPEAIERSERALSNITTLDELMASSGTSRSAAWSDAESDCSSLVSCEVRPGGSVSAPARMEANVEHEADEDLVFLPVLDHTQRASEVSVVDSIDTKDMVPVSFHNSPSSTASSSSYSGNPYSASLNSLPYGSSFSTQSHSSPSRPGQSKSYVFSDSLRSLDESLAEQQELLRQMSLASSFHSQR